MDQEVEDLLDSEVNKIYGRCRCCLDLGYVKNMWTKYSSEGAHEIYGEMLMETFSIAWDSPLNGKEQICNACVTRLRDAHMFKREVLASEQLLKEGVLDSESESIKEERLSDLDQYEHTTEAVIEDSECKEEDEEEVEAPFEEECLTDENVEYEEVEYLEEEMGPETKSEANDPEPDSDEPELQTKSVSRPKRKRTHGLNTRNYRNYSEDTLRQSIEAALNTDRSISEVAALYGVPRKTLTAKVYNAKHGPKPETPEEIEKLLNQERHYNFVQEVKKVLFFTNVVPFKIKSSRYYCAYCYTTIDSFEHPVDLRVHTQTHRDERLARLDQILRPQFLNEILRVDIEVLQCDVCAISLSSWNDMFVHLHEVHDVQLDQAYAKLVPYRLRDQRVSCALCNEEFAGFQYLDTHMNAHYCNYMCSECGDTFVTENRLKHHVLTHNTGRYPCSICGKVFSLEKYKKKHEAMVHREAKLFKCIDCGEAFHTEYERHTHVMSNHKERVRLSTCEICGKTYDWKPYYLAHMRKVHNKVTKYKCQYCGKGFAMKHDVTNHEMRHTGNGRHACVFCGKNFVTLTELKKHFKKHVKDIRNFDQKDMEQLGDTIIVLDGSEKTLNES